MGRGKRKRLNREEEKKIICRPSLQGPPRWLCVVLLPFWALFCHPLPSVTQNKALNDAGVCTYVCRDMIMTPQLPSWK
jgi:hypothetical protein